jgi:predicted TIM-barrel fold metal-dependent hydrolase
MRVIDVHTHAFPDALADRANARLESQCPWKAVARGTVGSLLSSMSGAGVDISLVCTIATRPDHAEGILKWCRQIRSDDILPLPSIHPDTPDAPRWLERIAAADFPGVKLHPMYQSFAIDEPRMDDIYAAAAACGLFIEFHCGRDIAFPDDDDRAAPQRTARVLDRHRQLKVVCTHMGGWKMWDEAEQCLLGRDVRFETSFTLSYMPAHRAADLIRRHGHARVMFGSDWPWSRQEDDLAEAFLEHPADALGGVYGRHAQIPVLHNP